MVTTDSTATPDEQDQWIVEAVEALPGGSVGYKPEWDSWLLLVADKVFGMRSTHAEWGDILTLKGNPAENEALRQEFDAVVPGYYANKQHWNSVLLDRAQVPRERVIEMMAESHRLVVAKLPKAARPT